MKKTSLIVNPTSGRGAGRLAIPRLEQLAAENRAHGEFEIAVTERPWHAAELAEQAARQGYDEVVAVGGDGTANEVLNGLLRARPAGGQPLQTAMGVLSVGRGNDFAFGMDVPPDLETGFQTLLKGCRRRIDVGFVCGGDFPKGRYFGNGVGIGFDAVVGFVAARMTRLHGFPSYIVAALKTVFLYFQAPHVRIELDNETLELPALMVSVMNGRRMGGGFMMAPQGKPSDGLFDLCIAGEVSKGRVFTLIPHFMRGTQATQPEIITRRARRITVSALRGALPAHADGETLCEAGASLVMEILPEQIDVITREEGEANEPG